MLIIGCGYLGQRVAEHYIAIGVKVCGVVRSRQRAADLRRGGVDCLTTDLDIDPNAVIPLRGASLFYFVPPSPDGVVDLRMRNLVRLFKTQGAPQRLVYLSTTGVYGDCGGAWVDETRPPAPVVPRACRRRDAELCLIDACAVVDTELVILRVGGIYGPGRLPLKRLRDGVPMVPESEAPFTNRIHIDDLVRVCVAAMEKGRSGRIYNVSDGRPSTMTDYFDKVAEFSGLPRAPRVPLSEGAANLSQGMLSYLRESRRIDNSRMLDELGVKLRYPDLASGLTACLDTDSS